MAIVGGLPGTGFACHRIIAKTGYPGKYQQVKKRYGHEPLHLPKIIRMYYSTQKLSTGSVSSRSHHLRQHALTVKFLHLPHGATDSANRKL